VDETMVNPSERLTGAKRLLAAVGEESRHRGSVEVEQIDHCVTTGDASKRRGTRSKRPPTGKSTVNVRRYQAPERNRQSRPVLSQVRPIHAPHWLRCFLQSQRESF